MASFVKQSAAKLNDKRLEEELANAVRIEQERQNVDDMKKRAVLTSRSYDEFKAFVACANLKPLTSKELSALGEGLDLKKRQFNFNKAAMRDHSTEADSRGTRSRCGRKSGGVAALRARKKALKEKRERERRQQAEKNGEVAVSNNSATAEEAKAPASVKADVNISSWTAPKNTNQFDRMWKKCSSSAQRWKLLQLVGVEGIPSLFKTDISTDRLGEIMVALHDTATNGGDGSDKILPYVEALTQTGRFALATVMLDEKEKDPIEDLLHTLHQSSDTKNFSADRLTDLLGKFCISTSDNSSPKGKQGKAEDRAQSAVKSPGSALDISIAPDEEEMEL